MKWIASLLLLAVLALAIFVAPNVHASKPGAHASAGADGCPRAPAAKRQVSQTFSLSTC